MFDIDIDIPSHIDITKIFPSAVVASRVDKGELVKHNCGVYFQNVPIDAITGFAALPYKTAADLGFTKVDFLHLNLLNSFRTKAEVRQAISSEPDWTLLQDPEIVSRLFHLKNSFEFLSKLKPQSVVELADVVAIIRPAKRALLDRYMRDKVRTRPLLYRLDGDDKTSFRQSHAIAYALSIVMQLNTITSQVLPMEIEL